jgi:predicted RNase H-like HicB family nuclease
VEKNMTDGIEFVAIVRENETGEFVLQFPDLPHCSALAATEEVAREIAPAILAQELEALRQGGRSLPKPSTFTAILTEGEWRAARSFRVRASAPAGQSSTPKAGAR